ncbi:MAG TPA: HlyC/CorC family transporter [Candidatus Latescibacteria bacterium]|nr:HlyC/CorC family transporter [Candidatus Latescibacterota bacterium]
MYELSLRLLLLLVLFVLSAFFSSSETAFFSLNRLQLRKMREDGSRYSSLVVSQLSRPQRLMSTILIGNMVVNIFAASLATKTLMDLFGDKGALIATVLMTFLIVIFGEITPKTFAIRNAEALARRAVLPIRLFSILIYPIRESFGALMTLLAPPQREKLITEDELRTIVEVGHGEGVVDRFEKETISRVLKLDRMVTKEIMTPRTEVFRLNEQTPLSNACIRIRKNGYARIPVWRGSDENITGVVYAKELLAAQLRGREGNLADFVHDVVFVPETKRLDDLLDEFRRKRRHLFVVIDEYGSLAGVVTLEDVLEEIVGRIVNHHDLERSRYRTVGDGVIRVSARMEVEHFNELFGTSIETGEFETMGGFVINRIGRIPRKGESFQIGQLHVMVTRASKNRILELEIRKAV